MARRCLGYCWRYDVSSLCESLHYLASAPGQSCTLNDHASIVNPRWKSPARQVERSYAYLRFVPMVNSSTGTGFTCVDPCPCVSTPCFSFNRSPMGSSERVLVRTRDLSRDFYTSGQLDKVAQGRLEVLL